MSALQELSQAVRARRMDMGLTQNTLAKLSGLSRATINQVENATLSDLSLTRAAKLLGVLGLSLGVTQPQPHRSKRATQSSALAIAARTASVSYREPLSTKDLRAVLTGQSVPDDLAPHIHTLLEEAPVPLLAAVADQVHAERGIERAMVWKTMKDLARHFQTNRELWQ